VDGGVVGHTTASELLQAEHPQSLRAFVRMLGQAIQWQCSGDLQHAVVTGEAVATRIVPDGGLWAYFAAHLADGQVFGAAMAANHDYHGLSKAARHFAETVGRLDCDIT